MVGSLDIHGAVKDRPKRLPEDSPERITVRLKIPLVLSGRPSGPTADLGEVDFITDAVNFIRLVLPDEVDHVPQSPLVVIGNLHVGQNNNALH
jgi:hypothetical protein